MSIASESNDVSILAGSNRSRTAEPDDASRAEPTRSGREDSAANSPPSCTSQGSRSRSPSINEPQSSRGRRTGKRVGTHASASTVASANRTKEETSHLIMLRDDMIEAKQREVLLLSKQNEVLRAGMDVVETEMASMHLMVETKEGRIHKLKREADRLRREIKQLRVASEEQKGRENAMDMAATQNTRLLKLLEQEELKREHVLSERDEALSEVAELKYRIKISDEQYAKRSAGLEVKLIKAVGENFALKQKREE